PLDISSAQNYQQQQLQAQLQSSSSVPASAPPSAQVPPNELGFDASVTESSQQPGEKLDQGLGSESVQMGEDGKPLASGEKKLERKKTGNKKRRVTGAGPGGIPGAGGSTAGGSGVGTTGPRLTVLGGDGTVVECQLETGRQKTVTFKFDIEDMVPEDIAANLVGESLLPKHQSELLARLVRDVVEQLKENPDKLPSVPFVAQAPSALSSPKKTPAPEQTPHPPSQGAPLPQSSVVPPSTSSSSSSTSSLGSDPFR
ncbi:hypothetical protein J437_LFUL000552, partial [Ladona fulva]